jgi:hypothetical protein
MRRADDETTVTELGRRGVREGTGGGEDHVTCKQTSRCLGGLRRQCLVAAVVP